jgi:shikimate kinase
MINKIYLTGFMGSGKSTIGPILANALGWDFFDLDVVIEQNEGKKIPRIFEENGEDYFRNLEKITLKKLTERKNIIIALGGGTIANQDNIDFIKTSGKIIYLKLSAESAYQRLKFKRDRPVLTPNGSATMSKTEYMDKITQLLLVRKKFYEQADITIDTNKLPLGVTVDKIIKAVQADIE